MPTLDSTTAAVRIRNSVKAEIDKVIGSRTMNRFINDAIEYYLSKSGTPSKIGDYATMLGATEEELTDLFIAALENGDILYDGKRLYMEPKPRG